MKPVHLTSRLLTLSLTNGYVLAVNTLSGAVDILDPQTHTILEGLRSGQIPPHDWNVSPECTQLRERSYIFDSLQCEEEWMTGLVNSEYANLPLVWPMKFAVHVNPPGDLTRRQQCTGAQESLTGDMVDAAFDAADELRERFCTSDDSPIIELTGGEPVQPSLQTIVARIVNNCRERDYKLDVVTDGAYLDRFVPVLVSAGDTLGSVQISLYDPGDNGGDWLHTSTGALSMIGSNMDMVLAGGVNCTIRVYVDGRNMEQIKDLVYLFEEKGWTWKKNFHCHLTPLTAHNNMQPDHILSEDQFVSGLQNMFRGEGNLLAKFSLHGVRILSRLAESLDENTITVRQKPLFIHCEAAGRYFGFAPDGTIYPCPRSIGDTRAALGSFYPRLELDDTKRQAWSERTGLTLAKCRSCKISTLCGGGCPYTALLAHGRPDVPMCENNEEVVVRYLNNKKTLVGRGLERLEAGA